MVENISVGLIRPISSMNDLSDENFKYLDDKIKRLVENVSNKDFHFVYHGLVSESNGLGIITRRIVQNTFDSDIVVGIMSGLNPNVMFELGLRLSQRKPTIIINDDKTEAPFDVNGFEFISYPRDMNQPEMEEFEEKFKTKFLGTWETFREDKGESTYIAQYKNTTQIIPEVEKISLTEAVDKLAYMIDVMKDKYVAIDTKDIWDDFSFEHDIAASEKMKNNLK